MARTDERTVDGTAAAAVLVPVKAFAQAKVRLSEVLDDDARAALARAMADRVIAAAAPLPAVVVCDDDGVADWAIGAGAEVIRADRAGLNGAVALGVEVLGTRGVRRIVVAHADLPFARGLAALTDAAPDEVLLVPDRRRDGTNVASVPAGRGFVFRYGPGSFRAHLQESQDRGLVVRVIESTELGWDVDEPDDLDPPATLGVVPLNGSVL